ncbi:DUF6262 family protein [Rothia sp. ZJ932]|uniref:DUF6262 family protein n=1 Tax=Rothia sp. ZJ932 TaxID=2810516 RepID=UPI001966EA0A|nr:DUF6262 family protein [Rothia sp. ZJ932]QRZ61716.1 hypothetical protein JR346_00790 [Rothia sp. ZJ932]
MPNIITDSSPQTKRADALRKAGKNRTQQATQRAEKAIRQLIKDGGNINFSSVARTAGVSTKFLHQNDELSDRIRTLADQQKGKSPRPVTPTKTAGESAIISILKKELENEKARNKKLREELHQLETAREHLLGRLLQYEDFLQ